jgi:type I site-specific restriction-modification system R (restriction) subunit
MIKKTLPKKMLLGGRLPLSAYQKSQEVKNSVPYLNRDSSEESSRDQAALPLHFEARLLNPRIDQAAANEAYANIPVRLSEEEQAEIASRAPQMAAIVKAPARIRAVVSDLAGHYREKVEPHGFKALVVAFDRKSCVLYKQELDRIMPPEASDIVMTVWQGDPLEWKQKYRRGKTDVERLLDRYRDPADSLKILIVNSKLLTTFDAPILQTMYLDKPMTEQHLLQAIRRTDRPYPDKTHGLIVDYLGLLDSILRSHSSDGALLRRLFGNLDELKRHSPARYEPVKGERDTFDSLLTDAYRLKEILARTEPEKLRVIERVIRARLHLHQNNPVFIAFGQQLEELKERHHQGLMISLEFLKHLLDLARAVVEAEKEVDPREAQEQVRADLTELFTEVCGKKSPKLVARIVNDLETAVRYNRFPNWQQDMNGKLEVRKTLTNTLQKYKLRCKLELIDRVYEYMEQYY